MKRLSLFLAIGLGVSARADEPVSYYRDIAPIFRQHCQGCHQPAKAAGGFVLSSYALLVAAGEDESRIVPGKPEESQLVEEITSQDGKPPNMPKGKDPLPKPLVEKIVRWIAAGAEDDTPAGEKVQFTADNPPTYVSPPVLTSLAFSPDGKLLAVSGNNEVLLHSVQLDSAEGQDGASHGGAITSRLVGLSERIESVVFSPDGKLLAVTGGSPARVGEVQIWDVEKRKLKLSYPVTYDTVYGASWSTDGTRVAFGCADNTLRAIDVTEGKQVLYQGAHSDWVLDTVFSTDSSHLISVSRDRSMKLVLVETERFVDNVTSITPGALKGGLIAIDRHPKKDEVLSGGADGIPKIYRIYREKARSIGDDFNLVRAFEPMPGRIFSVAYSADGTLITAGSSLNNVGEVRVYQESDAKQLSRSEFKKSAIYAVTFHPNGKYVAAGGYDGRIRIVEARTGKLLREFLAVPLAF